jgi:uncharacterized protein (DUF1499 family)
MMQKVRSFLVGLAIVAAIILPVWFLAGAMGTKFGVLDWTIGFGLMAFQLGPLLMMGALAIAFLALGAALIVKPRKGILAALLALIVPAAGLGYGASVRSQVAHIPPIHDISTDMIDPPAFSQAVAEARATITRSNDLDYSTLTGPLAGQDPREVQARAYPDVRPIRVEIDADDAWMTARDTVEAMGWTITREDQAAGVLEATVSSFWYGFTDDIVVRVRTPVTQVGAIIDLRSVSRVGVSDLGANAARIRAFRAAYSKRLEGAATGN